jgi:hypothetical protein
MACGLNWKSRQGLLPAYYARLTRFSVEPNPRGLAGGTRALAGPDRLPVERTACPRGEDLPAGRVVLGRQRLRGLVVSPPQPLELRDRPHRRDPTETAKAQVGEG